MFFARLKISRLWNKLSNGRAMLNFHLGIFVKASKSEAFSLFLRKRFVFFFLCFRIDILLGNSCLISFHSF